MSQTAAIWVLIVLAFVLANLPFYLQRSILFFPWPQPAEQPSPAWQWWPLSLGASLLSAALSAWAYLWLSQQFFSSSLALLAARRGVRLLAGGLFYIPGRFNADRGLHKSLFDRFIELTVLYFLVGILGVAFEASLGNVYPQGWEFYAITYSLFLVLGYPGFVLRYLLKRRRVLVSS